MAKKECFTCNQFLQDYDNNRIDSDYFSVTEDKFIKQGIAGYDIYGKPVYDWRSNQEIDKYYCSICYPKIANKILGNPSYTIQKNEERNVRSGSIINFIQGSKILQVCKPLLIDTFERCKSSGIHLNSIHDLKFIDRLYDQLNSFAKRGVNLTIDEIIQKIGGEINIQVISDIDDTPPILTKAEQQTKFKQLIKKHNNLSKFLNLETLNTINSKEANSNYRAFIVADALLLFSLAFLVKIWFFRSKTLDK